MLENIPQTVLRASFAQNKKMKMAIGSLFALLTQLTMAKVPMEPGEEARMNLMDTGSLMMMALLATGSAKTAK